VIQARLARLNPPPTRRIPILIGASGEKVTLRITAQHADIWHSSGDVETLRRKVDVLRAHCARVGRDPSEIEFSTFVFAESFGLIDEFLELGFTHFITGAGGPDYDLTTLERILEWRAARAVAA
jgi:hypothetical protein